MAALAALRKWLNLSEPHFLIYKMLQNEFLLYTFVVKFK